jgi:hypothetical protein
MSQKVREMRAAFLKLDKALKDFGRKHCKCHTNQKDKKPSRGMQCKHSAMDYGGMSRNTDCELKNCPRVLYDDEGE